jgi:hypothetical protein
MQKGFNAEIIKKTFGELLNKNLKTMRHTGSVAITLDGLIEYQHNMGTTTTTRSQE